MEVGADGGKYSADGIAGAVAEMIAADALCLALRLPIAVSRRHVA
jgi:hypothetical protein